MNALTAHVLALSALLFLPAGASAAEPSGGQSSAPNVTEMATRADPIAALMQEAKDAMLVHDYDRAIRLYTKVLENPAHAHRAEARELLGVARERNGQLAHAKAEYETYLREYPEGEDAERVRQRLAALITARDAAIAPLRAARTSDDAPQWTGFGSFSQFYRRDESVFDDDYQLNQSSLSTALDLNGRRRGPRYDLRARFTGDYLYDFLENGEDTEGRITSLYVEAIDHRGGPSVAIGRQSRSSGGLLGRFDGLILNQPLSGRYKLNLVAGKPVDTGNESSLNEHKQFYGLNMDAGTFAGAWDFNGFYIRQEVDGIKDREAAGGEARYFKDGRSFFGLLDYDLSFDVLNTALALANWNFPSGSSINLLADYRRSPILTTSNALISQMAADIDELLDTYSESEVRRLAEDRTAISRTITLSGTYPLREKLQLAGDISLSSLSGTPASGGVPETEATDPEASYAAQLIANDLFKPGDTAIIGLRYTNATSTDTLSLSMNTRLPLNERLDLNPRLRADWRTDAQDLKQNVYGASLRVNYRLRNTFVIEGELGGEWSQRELSDGNERYDALFFYGGFRKDF